MTQMPGQAVRKESFWPTWLGMLINPFYLARKALHREVVGISDQVAGRVLDVGCGQKPYAELFSCEEYVGLELDTPANRKTNPPKPTAKPVTRLKPFLL